MVSQLTRRDERVTAGDVSIIFFYYSFIDTEFNVVSKYLSYLERSRQFFPFFMIHTAKKNSAKKRSIITMI